MHIIISTVQRQRKYIESTVDGLICRPKSRTRVTFCVQGDWHYLEDFVYIGRIVAEESEHVRSLPAGERITRNFRRCLDIGDKTTPDDESVLILEDDLKFAKGWFDRAEEAFDIAQELFPGGFLLTLWHSYWRKAFKQLPHQVGISDLMLFNNQNDFYGNLALMMTPQMAGCLREWSLTEEASKLVGDQMVKAYFKKHNIPILTLDPCPVDHIGDESTLDPNIKVPRRAVNFA